MLSSAAPTSIPSQFCFPVRYRDTTRFELQRHRRHPSTGHLTRLREFWINGNPLELVPADIAELKELRVIDFSETKITSLPI